MTVRQQWEVTARLDRMDVAALRAALSDPPPQLDTEVVDRLLERLNRIWERKEKS